LYRQAVGFVREEEIRLSVCVAPAQLRYDVASLQVLQRSNSGSSASFDVNLCTDPLLMASGYPLPGGELNVEQMSDAISLPSFQATKQLLDIHVNAGPDPQLLAM
jgi:hypothetical protein